MNKFYVLDPRYGIIVVTSFLHVTFIQEGPYTQLWSLLGPVSSTFINL